jgi:hypothetical protein
MDTIKTEITGESREVNILAGDREIHIREEALEVIEDTAAASEEAEFEAAEKADFIADEAAEFVADETADEAMSVEKFAEAQAAAVKAIAEAQAAAIGAAEEAKIEAEEAEAAEEQKKEEERQARIEAKKEAKQARLEGRLEDITDEGLSQKEINKRKIAEARRRMAEKYGEEYVDED